ERMAQSDPADRYASLAVAISTRALGWALVQGGDRQQGIARLHRARAAVVQVVQEDPGNGYARNEQDTVDYYLAKSLLAPGASASTRSEGCAATERVRASWHAARDAGRLGAASASLQEVEGLHAQCSRRP